MEWEEQRRLEQSVYHAVDDARKRIKELEGKNRYALQQEFLDWLVLDWDDLEVDWFRHYED